MDARKWGLVAIVYSRLLIAASIIQLLVMMSISVRNGRKDILL